MPERRQLRERDFAYLAFIRQQPCCICQEDTTVEAAHLRVGSIGNDEAYTGFGEKSSDRWALPLCGRHYREQHSMGEREFWASFGINPFLLAMSYRMPRR